MTFRINIFYLDYVRLMFISRCKGGKSHMMTQVGAMCQEKSHYGNRMNIKDYKASKQELKQQSL